MLNQQKAFAGIGSGLNRIKAFLAWRKSQPVLLEGDIHFHEASEPVLAFTRNIGAEAMLCVFNLKPEPASYDLPMAISAVEGHGFSARLSGKTVNLPAYGAFFGRYQR